MVRSLGGRPSFGSELGCTEDETGLKLSDSEVRLLVGPFLVVLLIESRDDLVPAVMLNGDHGQELDEERGRVCG